MKKPYHLPTTNISFKLNTLPKRDEVFDSRLVTGEDALLIRQLRKDGKLALFSPKPTIEHRDREKFSQVVRHHVEWGHHQYFIQLGNLFSPTCLKWWYRIAFLIFFIPALPFFAALNAYLNIKP